LSKRRIGNQENFGKNPERIKCSLLVAEPSSRVVSGDDGGGVDMIEKNKKENDPPAGTSNSDTSQNTTSAECYTVGCGRYSNRQQSRSPDPDPLNTKKYTQMNGIL
jgi:hypothetical protein